MLHPVDAGRATMVQSFLRPLSSTHARLRQVSLGGWYFLLVTQTTLVRLRGGNSKFQSPFL